MAERNPSLYLQNRTDHTAENDRSLITSVFGSREGVLGSGDLLVAQRAAGANMSVDVAIGRAVILGDNSPTVQGTYHVWNDAVKNVVISAASGVNPRKDIVVAIVRDAFYSGATNAWALEVVTGTAAASPVEPALPSNAIKLALVDVPTSAASILTANITDKRPRAVALGGTTVCTSATRPTVALYEGLDIYETDTDRVLTYDGTNWVVVGVRWDSVDSAVGTTPTATQKRELPLIIQSGSKVVTTSALGGNSITFPFAFPNGVLSIVVAQGDGTAGAAEMVAVEAPTLSGFTSRFYDHDGAVSASVARRLNWIATGF